MPPKDIAGQPLHIYSAMQQFAKMAKVRMHMPAHKGRGLPIVKDSFLDCTELSLTDCLECPTSSILQAEADIASIFEAEKSFIVTDGATCGIFALVYAVKMRGSKLVIARNSHKSVYNACSILGVEPVVLPMHMQNGIPQQPEIAELEKILQTENDITAILLTSPDYYGNICNLEQVAKICKAKDILLLIDNAHGAFMQFDAAWQKLYAGKFADAWVDSLHKTTPCLTQGAVLHTNNKQLAATLLDGLHIFRTTSPSYLIMASIEYAAKYMQQFGNEKVAKVRQNLQWAERQLGQLSIQCYSHSATLALVVDFLAAGYATDSVQLYLEKRGIFTELNDGRYLLFYCSSETTKRDIKKLVAAIKQGIISGAIQKIKSSVQAQLSIVPQKVLGYVAASGQALEYLPLECAIGKIAAKNVGVTPPCFPLCIAGEKITEQIVERLKTAPHTFGLQNGTIAVLLSK